MDTNNYNCTDQSDLCMAGDLSGKYGKLNIPAMNVIVEDDNLTINDILGRSVRGHFYITVGGGEGVREQVLS